MTLMRVGCEEGCEESLIGILQKKGKIIIKRKMKRKNNVKWLLVCVMMLLSNPMNLNGQDFLEADQGEQSNHLLPYYPAIDVNGVVHDITDIVQTNAQIGLMTHIPSPNIRSVVEVYGYGKEGVYDYGMSYTKRNEVNKTIISNSKLEISEKLAKAIHMAWRQMLIETRYPKKSWLVLDAKMYYFETFVIGIGPLRGKIQRPRRGLPLKMVKLGEKLEKITEKEKPLTPKEEELLIKELSEFENSVKETFDQ